LGGLRVIELAGIGPAPFAAMMLADAGAEVLRVDRPQPQFGTTDAPQAARREILNRGRRSAILDLKQPEGSETLLRLVETADILIEGLRPGVTERLGIGPDECLARNPRLIYARMTGWGQDGPLAPRAGHDIGYIARTGALHASGRAEGPPEFAMNLLGDFGGGGMLILFGITAALHERTVSGKGQVVDAAIVDGTASLMAMTWQYYAQGVWRDERGVNPLDGGLPWYDVYETSDGGWMAVGALEPPFYEALLAGLGITGAPPRYPAANHAALRELFAARFKQRTRDEWTATFADVDACVEPVLSMTEAAADDHMRSRGTYVEADGVLQPGPAPRFSRTPSQLSTPPPVPGQDTAQALRDWGIADVGALIEASVAVQR
jgi:alpha-methylacyl-CoA racemase